MAGQAAAATGLDSGILKYVLPIIAAAAMSNMLTSMLDADGDGSVADDLLDMAKKFF